MSKTFKVPKEFVLYKLFEHGPTDRRFGELEKRLPPEVVLNEEFVRDHMRSMDWLMAMERLLEGSYLMRALARENEASELLNLALKRLQQEYSESSQTLAVRQEYQKVCKGFYDDYNRALARAFVEEAELQGGWDIRDAQEIRRIKPTKT